MKVYKSPVYAALMIHIPGPNGERAGSVKAAGGFFNVPDSLVDGFEAVIAERPHYKIEYVGTAADPVESTAVTTTEGAEHGAVVPPESLTDAEKHPEKVTVESLEQLKVPELDARLEKLGLPTDGLKADKIVRLAEATNTATGQNDEDDADNDDADDDDAE